MPVVMRPTGTAVPCPRGGSDLHHAVPRQVQRTRRAGQADRAGLADDDLLHDGHLLPRLVVEAMRRHELR
ncbi:hypothetical protein KPATCC21470_8380 [Kitasatospora purpeofusca]